MLSRILPQIISMRPLFEGTTFGFQGLSIRHLYLASTVCLVNKDRGRSGLFSILEIGSWTGSSVLTWAQAIQTFCASDNGEAVGHIHCIDPWDSYISEGDIRSEVPVYRSMEMAAKSGIAYELFLHNTKFVPKCCKVTHTRAKASDVLPYFRPESFDIVYIDGSHYYKDVLFDIELSKPLVRDGGILCGDDLELPFSMVDEQHARTNLDKDFILDPRTNSSFHPGVSLAISEAFEAVSIFDGYWAVRRGPEGYERISLNGLPTIVPNHFSDQMKAEIRARLDSSER